MHDIDSTLDARIERPVKLMAPTALQRLKVKTQNIEKCRVSMSGRAAVQAQVTDTDNKDRAQAPNVTAHAGEIVGSAQSPSAKLVHLPSPFAAIGIS